MKKGLLTFVLTTSLIGLTGCNGDNQNAGNVNNDTNLGVNNVQNNANIGRTGINIANQNLRISTKASTNVVRLPEVERAYVIVRNNDAYVAVRLTNNQKQQNTTGNQAGTRNQTPRTGNNSGTANITGTGSTGIGDNNTTTGRGSISGNNTGAGTDRITGTGNTNGNGTSAGITGIGSGTNIENTGTGYIGTNTGNAGNGGKGTNTGNTGTNGTGTNNGDTGTGGTGTIGGNTGTNVNQNNGTGGTGYKEVSTRLEQKIADQVRAADKKIHKVYVSYDTDFYDQMTTYANDLQNGRNPNGIWIDFTNTVQDFFK